jgi:hypothetical protein
MIVLRQINYFGHSCLLWRFIHENYILATITLVELESKLATL